MWGKPTAFVFIRPQRYTKEFIDASEEFSINVLGDAYRNILNYCGTVSGRDEDKIKNSNLTVDYKNDTPYFDESKIVLICRKVFARSLKKNALLINLL